MDSNDPVQFMRELVREAETRLQFWRDQDLPGMIDKWERILAARRSKLVQVQDIMGIDRLGRE